MPDMQGAQPDSPPVDDRSAIDAVTASSAEDATQASVSEPGTPPSTPAVPEKKPWNLPPEERWQEVLRERDEARRAYQELAARAVQTPQPMGPATPPADPWDGLLNHPDPATAQFYQQQKRLVEHAVQRGREQALQELQPILSTLQQGQASIQIREFRKENPEIKPGSEEERQVIAYMQGQMDGIRHPLESAKRNAMFDRLESENRALKTKQGFVQTKVAANASDSQTGIPGVSGLPQRPADWRDRVRDAYRKGGDITDVVNAVGMRKSP